MLFEDESSDLSESTIWRRAVDVWAFGCVYARVVTMTSLYADLRLQATNPDYAMLLLSSIADGVASPADGISESTIPADLYKLIRECVQVAPNLRPSMDQIMSRLQAQGGTSRSIHVEQKRAGRKDKAQKHRLPNAHVLPVPGWLEKQRTDRRSDTTATLHEALSRSSVRRVWATEDHQEQTPLHESLDRSSVAGIYGFAEPLPLQSSLSRASVADAYGVSDLQTIRSTQCGATLTNLAKLCPMYRRSPFLRN